MNEAAEGDNIGMHWRYWRQIVKCLLFPCFFLVQGERFTIAEERKKKQEKEDKHGQDENWDILCQSMPYTWHVVSQR